VAPVLPNCEPTDVVAGDTWSWTHENAEFPVADGWVLSYSIRGASALTWNTAWVTNDGRLWTVAIPTASTAPLTAGTYRFERHYAANGQRWTTSLRTLEIVADAATAVAGALQSDNEKMLAALWTLLYGNGTVSDVESYQIHGRQLVRMKKLELQKWYDVYRGRVRREQNGGQNPAIRIAFGHARS
jgi:hypothetical protein